MKKTYILPALSLTLCLFTAAKTSLGSAAPISPVLLRSALFMSEGRESGPDLRPSIEDGAEEKPEIADKLMENTAPIFERTITTAPFSAEGLHISNLANAKFDTAELLSLPNEQRGAAVLILHSHGCEAYTPTKKYSYRPTEDFRTTDTDFNMVRVGDEIEKALTGRGIRVIHDRTLCDEDDFNRSYANSLSIANRYVSENSDIKVILDVHRDSIEGEGGERIKTVGAENTAQLMFVVGTDKNGLDHPLWRQNLAFALKLQQRLQTKYPDLMRPVNLSKNRYNQHVSTGSIIVEVGTDANTLEEALNAARIFGEELGDYLS